MRDMSEQGADFLRELGNAASRNPVSAALIGMGALWLFSGRGIGRTRDTVRSGMGHAADAGRHASDDAGSAAKSSIGSAAQTLQDSAAGVVDRATKFSRQQADTVSEYAKAIPQGTADTFGSVRSGLADLFERQPLALAALGVAIGAGIAAALPTTEVEAEYLGEASDAMKEKAREFAADQVDHAGAVAEKAYDAAADEARNQGLTTQGVNSAADEMTRKLHRVLDAAKEGASAKADWTR